MTTLNKRLFDIGQKLTPIQKRAIKLGNWRISPDKILTWQYRDETRSIWVMFQGSNMAYILPTQEEYLKAKESLDNYNF